MARGPLLLLILLAAGGCRTHSIKSPATTPAVARIARPETLWRVSAPGSDEPEGWVVYFRSSETFRDSVYMVRNRWHQDLGLVDGLGRAFRYRPHQEEAQWVGSGTLLEGVRLILGGRDDLELVEDSISRSSGARAAISPPAAQVGHPAATTNDPREGTS